jgi:catechol 2,3-dioxygenase-like lactoylglutathione lyase family enzyme
MNNKPRFGFVVEYVKDIEAAKDFYVDVLGLEMQRYYPTFVQFDKFAIASDQPIGATGEPELYWLVDDAAASYRELSQKAEVVAPLTQKPFGKVFAINDADGRPRYLLELSRERPSQAVK